MMEKNRNFQNFSIAELEEYNTQPTSTIMIVITVIVVNLFLAAVIWLATLEVGELVMIMLVALFSYLGWRFLFG